MAFWRFTHLHRSSLDRSALRWITLSTAGGKEGLKKAFFTLFATCCREGDPAKRRSGESLYKRQVCLTYFYNFINLI